MQCAFDILAKNYFFEEVRAEKSTILSSWMGVHGCGLLWTVGDGGLWLWVVVDGYGWLWMVVDCYGWL